jgi:RimJ/RimL family protein N-acetyltransferase
MPYDGRGHDFEPWRQGYAMEAAKAALSHGFDKLPVKGRLVQTVANASGR